MKIKAIYEYCKKNNNKELEKSLDAVVKEFKAYDSVNENIIFGSPISHKIIGLFESNGVMHDKGEIINLRNIITEHKQIPMYLKKIGKISLPLYESVRQIIDGYAYGFGSKKIIFKDDIKNINEALNYFEIENKGKLKKRVKSVNESLEDLSNLSLSEGSFDIDNYGDFISTFNDNYVLDHKDILGDDLSMYFNDGGVIIISIFASDSSLTGYSATLGYRDGDSTLMNRSELNSLTKKFIETDIADEFVNESKEEDDDDFGMTDYCFEKDTIKPGMYQILESDVKTLEPFDLIEVKEDDGKTIKAIIATGKEATFDKKDLKSVICVSYDEYDKVFECAPDENVLNRSGVTINDLKILIGENNIKYEDVLAEINKLKSDQSYCIVDREGVTIHYDTVKNEIVTSYVDDFGDTQNGTIGDECLISTIILNLVYLNQSMELNKIQNYGYESKYLVSDIYNACILDERLRGDAAADFIEEFKNVNLLYLQGSPFTDTELENLLTKHGLIDLLLVSKDQDGFKDNSFTDYSCQDVVNFLSSQFPALEVPALIDFITDEKASLFTKLYNEFYLQEENQDALDPSLGDRYVDLLLNFMKDCGINISAYH